MSEGTQATETIVVCDDEPAVRRLVQRVLAREGYSVLAAAAPSEALELAAGVAIDVLVSDVLMPEMSGPDLARRLLESHPGLRVLFISGWTAQAVDRSDWLAGSRLLGKPFNFDQLLGAVRELLDAGG